MFPFHTPYTSLQGVLDAYRAGYLDEATWAQIKRQVEQNVQAGVVLDWSGQAWGLGGQVLPSGLWAPDSYQAGADTWATTNAPVGTFVAGEKLKALIEGSLGSWEKAAQPCGCCEVAPDSMAIHIEPLPDAEPCFPIPGTLLDVFSREETLAPPLIFNPLPRWVTAWGLAGLCFDRSLQALAVYHRLPVRNTGHGAAPIPADNPWDDFWTSNQEPGIDAPA